MKLRDLLFLAIVILVVGGLYYLSTRDKARPVPSTPPHLAARERGDCLVCHTPEKLGELELKHKHPGKWRDARVSCMRCHQGADSSRASLH
jgi:hypothetical protein